MQNGVQTSTEWLSLCAIHREVAKLAGCIKNSQWTFILLYRHRILDCECVGGYTGTYCDTDIDACEENKPPCFPGVQCIDEPPPADNQGYKCGPCPTGYTGDGKKCDGKYESWGIMMVDLRVGDMQVPPNPPPPPPINSKGQFTSYSPYLFLQ